MPAFEGLVAAMVAGVAILFVRYGLREWRNDDSHEPLSRRFGLLLDERVAAGYDHCALLIGAGCGFIAIMMVDVLTANLNDPSKAVSIIFALASVGIILSAALSFLIIAFNQPKFLVPPRHRSELGAVTRSRHPGAGLRGR